MQIRKPKSELMEFYQLHIGKPSFEVQSGPPPPLGPKFLCTLTIPAVDCAKGSYAEQEFSGEGKSKRDSEHAASEKALAFIRAQGLLSPAIVPDQATQPQSAVLQALGLQPQPSANTLTPTAAPENGMANGNGSHSSTPPVAQTNDEAELESLLDFEALAPKELRIELERALEENSRLKRELWHENRRRSQAVQVLLGISTTS